MQRLTTKDEHWKKIIKLDYSKGYIRQKLYCMYDEQTHDYRRRRDIVHTEILLPPNAPREFMDYQTFGNAVEMAEKRKDARIAREIILALPRELTIETNITMVRDFVTHRLVGQGMCGVVAVHRGSKKGAKSVETDHLEIRPHNPHEHILLTTRSVGPGGFSNKKNRNWDKREFLIELRKQWADVQNRYFVRKGLDIQVSHESYAKQGIDREPTFHLGPVLSEMERREIRTHLGNINRAIEERNEEYDRVNNQQQLESEQDYDVGRSR